MEMTKESDMTDALQ